MIKLYIGSGAQDVTLLAEKYVTSEWISKRARIKRLLSARNNHASIELLDRFNFLINEGTNGFGDEFNVLNAEVSPEDYVAFEGNEYADTFREPARLLANTTDEIVTDGYIRFVLITLDHYDVPEAVSNPEPRITSEVVEAALNDAETLINTTGASSAIDRTHTAIHGYLKAVCQNENITYTENTNLLAFWNLLRQHHPKFADSISRNDDIVRIFRAISNIFESINNLRNNGSVAHPNDELIENKEAMLVVNCSRSILHYIDSKISDSD